MAQIRSVREHSVQQCLQAQRPQSNTPIAGWSTFVAQRIRRAHADGEALGFLFLLYPANRVPVCGYYRGVLLRNHFVS
mgnify:CR=1 FL=1